MKTGPPKTNSECHVLDQGSRSALGQSLCSAAADAISSIIWAPLSNWMLPLHSKLF